MNSLNQILPQEIISVIGWVLFHSVWQGVLASFLLAIGLLSAQKQNAKIKYAFALASLFFMFISASVTFIYYYEAFALRSGATIIVADTSINSLIESSVNTDAEESYLEKAELIFTQNRNFIVSIWFIGMILFSLRFLGGAYFLRRQRKSGIPINDTSWTDIISFLKDKIGYSKAVTVFESVNIKTPVTFGFFKPVILLPLGLISGLPQTQIEAILIHELAHIKRNDFLINLMQCFIQSVFFYHPAVWWISSVIGNERENCCDDITIEACGNQLEYSKALYNLQLITNTNVNPALALTGHKNYLLRRIKRMNEKNKDELNYGTKMAAFFVLLITIAAVTFADSSSSGAKDKSARTTIAASVISTDFIESKINSIKFDSVITDSSKSKNKKQTLRFFENKDGDSKRYKAKLNNGNLEELYIDGKKVEKNELSQHEKMVKSYLKEYETTKAEYNESRKKYRESMKKFNGNRHGFHFNSSEFDFDDEIFDPIDKEELRKVISDVHKNLEKAFANKSIRIPPIQIPEIIIPPIPPIPHEDWEEMREEIENNYFDKEEFKKEMKDWKVDFKKEMKKLKEELKKNKWDSDKFKVDMEKFGVEMKKFGKFMRDVKDELIGDGLINDEDNIDNFELSKDYMIVNDEKVKPELQKKYLILYKKHFGKELTDDNKIRINN